MSEERAPRSRFVPVVKISSLVPQSLRLGEEVFACVLGMWCKLQGLACNNITLAKKLFLDHSYKSERMGDTNIWSEFFPLSSKCAQ